MGVASVEIVGREAELRRIEEFLDRSQSLPAALVLDGEAGIGKTTLWQAGIERAGQAGYRVLSCAPAEAETQLSFVALRDLLDDEFDEVQAALPSPQRHALSAALLREDASTVVEAGSVRAAARTALRLLARNGRLLIAVDDVQWLDPPSAAVLEFAVRRLGEDSVAFLLARRGAVVQHAPLGLARALPENRIRRLVVGPLSIGALHRLLHERLDAVYPRPTLVRIFDASAGNPFFALEIARALTTRGGRLKPGEPIPVPTTLDEVVRDRLTALPAETRATLGLAAAVSQPTTSLLHAAGAQVSSLAPAVDAQVIELRDGRVRFMHPLLSSVAYAALGETRREAIHARLAEIVEDPEERARHLALAVREPDHAVATALDAAAEQARGRGAPATAAGHVEEAIRLTPHAHVEDALRRTITAASCHFDAGDAARARALLEQAVAMAPAGPARAEALTLLARAHAFGADHRVAAALYREALAEADEDSRLRVYAKHGLAVTLMRMLVDLPEAADHARSAAELAERLGDTFALAESVADQALIEGMRGGPEASDLMRRAASLAEHEASGSSWYFLRGLWGPRLSQGVLATWHDRVAEARDRLNAARLRAVELGDEAALPLLLRHLSYAEWLAGDWNEALRRAEEGFDAAVQTGQPTQRAVLAGAKALLRAHFGDVTATRSEADEALKLAQTTGAMLARLLALSAVGILELSRGDPQAAYDRLEPLVVQTEAAGIREPGLTRFIADAVEALVSLGRLDESESLLSQLEERARSRDRASALGAAARCSGLLAAARGDLGRARAELERALREHERVEIPFDRARTLLALGSIERRAKQKRAARDALDEALAQFERLGARLWAENARTELARIGGRAPSAADGLTPTERRVAELVAEGRSNKEVASALFVTPKTVAVYLSRIYAKLGVRSRTELARRLFEETEGRKL